MRTHLISLLITAAWLVMMALLVRNHLLPHPIGRNAERLDPAVLQMDWQDQHEHMLIRQSGRTLGASAMHLVRDPETGAHRFSQALRFRVGLGSFTTQISLGAAAELGTALDLERFWARMGASGLETTVRGQVIGDDLIISVESPMGSQGFRHPLEEPISLLDAVRPGVFEQVDLVPGASYRIPSADLLGSMSDLGGALPVGDLVLEVQDYDLIETEMGRIPAYEIATSFAGAVSMVWVDESGRVVRQQIWADIFLERASRRILSDMGFDDILESLDVPDFDLTGLETQTLDTNAVAAPLSLRRLLSEGME